MRSSLAASSSAWTRSRAWYSPTGASAGQQRLDRVDLGPFLDDDAIEIEHQAPSRTAAGLGRVVSTANSALEEQQHEDEHQPVLDAHQKPPDLTSKLHASNLLLAPN